MIVPSSAKRKTLRGLIIAICLLCTVLFSACDSRSGDGRIVSERENELYLYDIEYNPEELTMCAVVSFKGDEEKKLNSKLRWKSTSYTLNVLFRQEDVAMTVDSSAVIKEIEEMLTDDERNHEGEEYKLLKVVLRYDTIYKSILSDGSVTKSGRYYKHLFDFDGAEEIQTFSLHLKTQISANWYTLLIAFVLILSVIIIAVTLAVKGKLWQKKKM